MQTHETVDAYIASFPTATQEKLFQIRQLIQEIAPGAEEKIGYGMPAYKYGKTRFYFAGYAKHIGFYPGAACMHLFAEKLSAYKMGKGSIQFSLTQDLPLDLIRELILFRITEGK